MRKTLHEWDCKGFTLTRATAKRRPGTNKHPDAAIADALRRRGTHCSGITATLRLLHCLSNTQITPAGGGRDRPQFPSGQGDCGRAPHAP